MLAIIHKCNVLRYKLRLASYKLNDAELARDLIQKTFLSAIKATESFRGDSSEKTWLVRILNNKIIDHFRASKKEIPMSEYLDNTENSFSDHFFDLRIPLKTLGIETSPQAIEIRDANGPIGMFAPYVVKLFNR